MDSLQRTSWTTGAMGIGCDSSSCVHCHGGRSKSVAALADDTTLFVHHANRHSLQLGSGFVGTSTTQQVDFGSTHGTSFVKCISAPNLTSIVAGSSADRHSDSEHAALQHDRVLAGPAADPLGHGYNSAVDLYVTGTGADARLHGGQQHVLQQVSLPREASSTPALNEAVPTPSSSSSACEGSCCSLYAGSDEVLTTWRFQPEWAALPDPVPAAFAEVAAFAATGGQQQHQRPRERIVCGIDFADTGHVFATASVAKQVCVYALLGGFTGAGPLPRPAVAVHSLPSKLSSLVWVPHTASLVTVGDYDGVVITMDVASGHFMMELDEHDGRRVLSVAHSRVHPGLFATAAEDGVCRLWGGPTACGRRGPLATLRPATGTAVCGVDFCGSDGNLLALASANGRAYVYDLRNCSSPLVATSGHARAASYARFLGPRRLVTAGVDGRLSLWDLAKAALAAGGAFMQAAALPSQGVGSGRASPTPPAAPLPLGSTHGSSPGHPGAGRHGPPHHPARYGDSAVDEPMQAGPIPCACESPSPHSLAELPAPWRSFHGHSNRKNFVGLAVAPEHDLIATGSECSRVFAYRTSWGCPLASHCLDDGGAASQGSEFVSAVAWQPDPAAGLAVGGAEGPLLVAATSGGQVKALQLRLRTHAAPVA